MLLTNASPLHFDQIASLPKREPIARLHFRTAYVQLAQSITELKEVVEANRSPHHLPFYYTSENTIASDAYLKVKLIFRSFNKFCKLCNPVTEDLLDLMAQYR
jgi:hypothetical protein